MSRGARDRASVAGRLACLAALAWLSACMPTAGPPVGTAGQEVCRAVRVVDGDTLDVSCAGRPVERIRLLGVDTPELFSPQCRSEAIRARGARNALRAYTRAAGALTVRRRGTDRYDRVLARVYADGADLGLMLVTAGHGRPYHGGPRRGWCV